MAIAYTRSSAVSVIPADASDAAPRRAMKNASTTAKMDSPTISSAIGTASTNTAGVSGPDVRSRSEPRSASTTSASTRRVLEPRGMVTWGAEWPS